MGKARQKSYQRKFSLVPFSRDIKKRNSDYEGDESFDPYETSNHFAQSKVAQHSKKESPAAQEASKRNVLIRRHVEITPEKVVTIPPLEERLRVAIPNKIHATKAVESAITSASKNIDA